MNPLSQRPLGRTGLVTSRMGLGLAALGRPAYHVIGHSQDLHGKQTHDALETHAISMMNTAYDAGIRYFDAARSYGDAERFLKHWLTQRAPDDVCIGSKWGYVYVGDWKLDARIHEVKHHDLSTFLTQRDESLANLGDHLALYAVHSLTPESPVLSDPALLDALDALRERGISLAITASGPHQADVIDRVRTDHAERFSVVHATFNVLEPSAGPALARAHAAGFGVIVKEGLANGRLTARAPEAPVREKLTVLSEALHTTPDALSLAWVLTHDFVDVVLSGATTPEQLTSNVRACALQLPPPSLDALAALGEGAQAYWTHRKSLVWT